MRIRILGILGIIVSFMLISSGLAISQEQTVQGGAVPPQGPMSQETEWIWGEVSSVDLQNKLFVVKYLDYETDQEKEMTLEVDEKTAYENIRSLEEMKPNDTLSVDYIVSSEGKNIARNISIEKPEVMPVVPQEPAQPAQLPSPEPAQPTQ